MGHSFISAIMIALFVAGPAIGASNEEESLGTVSPPKSLTIDCGGGAKMEFILIPAGEFVMGQGFKAQHKVKISKPFYMSKHEVTQAQWEAVMNDNPSKWKGPNLPVEQVSWNACRDFCKKLSQGLGRTFRLPTEAEWEYACHAGTTTDFSFGGTDPEKNMKLVDEYAWYNKNSEGKTHTVGAKKPNPWGLHDMHGNVSEWCHDWHAPYSPEPQVNPTGPTSGTCRADRGGSFDDALWSLVCTTRGYTWASNRHSSFGCRLVLDEKTSHLGAKPSAENRKDAAETALARAEILSLQGSSEEAYAAFEEVLNLAVDAETKARATVGMARVLDRDGRSKEAQELYLKASGLTTNPNTKAMILIGQTGPLLQQRRLAEVRTKVEEALGLATEPQTKAVAMMTASGLDVLEGHVEQGRKRFVAAGEMVESAIRGAEDNEKKAHLKLVLATIFMAQSRWNDVETTIDEAFDLTENAETKCGILQFQGGIFSYRKQTERARQSFEQALKLAPTPDHMAKCFTGLGEVDEYEGNPSEALANYDKALAQATSKETRSLALFKKGTVLMEQGSSQEAILSFEEVIRLTRSVHRKARSLANIGSALAGQGKLTEARGKLEEALSFPLRPSVKKQIENLLQKVERAMVK